MLKLEVFDPAMCCATGICGNSVDPKLVTFASDLEWLKKQGIEVIRHGLSFEPAEFVKNEAVKSTLQSDGNDCLPIVVIDNEIVSKACYPSRAKLAEICKLEYKEDFGGCGCGSECDCSNAPAEDNCCGPDCDCHKSAISDKSKNVLFITVILIMLAIIAVKMAPKAHSAEVQNPLISSTDQVKPTQDIAFIYIPSKNDLKISKKAKNAMLSAQKILKAKNINADLFTLNFSSAEYDKAVSQTKTPAVMVVAKGKGKSFVSGDINTNRLLQAYMAATLAGGCGAGCPCHKK